MSYPAYVNGCPPTITLAEYDGAAWAGTTCIDRRNGQYVVVIMETPETVVAAINSNDDEVLDKIFRSAHAKHAEQSK